MLQGKLSQRTVATVLALALLGGSVVAAVAQGTIVDTFTGKYYKGKMTEGASAGQTINFYVAKQKADQLKLGSNNPGVIGDACINVKIDGAKIVQTSTEVGGCGVGGRGGGGRGGPAADAKLTIDTGANPVSLTYSPTAGTTFVGTLVPQN